MSDREFLELAAKAAGMEPPFDALGGLRAWVGSPEGGHWWEPLTDDGDALRLMHAIYRKSRPDDWIRIYDNLWGGSLEDMRRAIVRAAAEIGESMP